MRYRLDTSEGKLVPDDPPFARVHSGAAPRHLSFHPNGRYVYVNGEADMTISAFTYPDFVELQVLPTVPEDAPREGLSTAQIMVSPDGRPCTSNRGHDSLAMFAIDSATVDSRHWATSRRAARRRATSTSWAIGCTRRTRAATPSCSSASAAMVDWSPPAT